VWTNEKSGNFVLHPLWIPVIYNIAILKNIGDNLFYTIGKNQSIKINTAKTNSEEVLHIKDNFNKTDFIPKTGKTANGKQITLFQEGNIKQSGNYYIYSNNKKIKGISYNYNRKESDLKFNNIEEINKKLQSGKNINIKIIEEEGNRLLAKIENDTKNSNIYKIFVIIALIFISFEIILLRFLK